MSKVFETQFEKGSLIDRWGGNVGTLTDMYLNRTDQGIALHGDVDVDNHKFQYPSEISVDPPFSIVCNYRVTPVEQWDQGYVALLGNLGDGTYSLLLRYSSPNIRAYFYNGGESIIDVDFIGDPKSVWRQLTLTNDGTNVKLYDNNVLKHEESFVGVSIDTPFKFDALGLRASNVYEYRGDISKVTFHDKILTAQERSQAYNEFLQAGPVGIEKHPRYNPHSKPIDLSNESEIIAAYNMIPQGDTLVDISGNGNGGTVYKVPSHIDGMKFNTDPDLYIDLNSDLIIPSSGDFTITFRCKRDEIVNYHTIFGHKTVASRIQVWFGNQSLSNLKIESDTAGNQAIGDLNSNDTEWHDYVITKSSGTVSMYQDGVALTMTEDTISVDTTIQRIGKSETGFSFDGIIEDIRVYSRSWSLKEVKDYHNFFARRVKLIEDFRFDPVGSTLPQGWIKGTGAYEVKELAAQDSVLKHLDVGTKYLECTSAGTIAIPSKSAYGTWEFDINKGSDFNILRVNFISDRSVATLQDYNGYRFSLHSNEAAYLVRDSVGSSGTLMNNAIPSMENNVWYRFKITRTKDGEFTMWLKGGSFGDVYVLLVADTGSNPATDTTHTISKYFVIDYEAGGDGDRIANIKITEGVIQ